MSLEGYGDEAPLLMLVPIALTVLAFLVLRSMARTALRLDDAEAASAAAMAAASRVPPGSTS
jgi:hypothetical protein